MVESSTRRPRPVSTPVCSTTWRTASKIRRGRAEWRMRLRQYTSTVGWKPSSSRCSPQATFQAMSRRNALMPPGRSGPPGPAAPSPWRLPRRAPTDARHPGGPHRRTARVGTAGGGGRRGRRAPTRRGSGGDTRSPRPAGRHQLRGVGSACLEVCFVSGQRREPPDRHIQQDRPNHAPSADS